MSNVKRIVNSSLPVLLAVSMIFTPLMTVASAGQAVRAPSALLLAEDFNYGSTPGNLTTISGGLWVAHSGAGSGPVQYITSGLSMLGYGSSGVGGAATISTGGSEDVNRSFTNQTSGTVYFAALVNVSQAGTGDYFLHFKDATTNFRARVFVKDDSGILRFGLGTTGAATYSTAAFEYNKTYLVVAKYEVTTGNTALYVLNIATPTEPATPLVYLAGSGSLAVQGIAIRQGTAGQRPSATIDGIRVANTWEEVIGFTGYLSLTKEVTPTTNVAYHSTVTYTVTLENSMAISDTVLFTDTLPAEVDFGAWIEQPAGATVTNDQITWSGALTASTALTFSFTAVHVGDYGDVVTNTAEFSGTTQTGSASAVFTVEENLADVTFVYHDLEGVVQAGETVWLAGSWDGWTPVQMGNAGSGVYTRTVPGLLVGTNYSYKYIVNDGATNQWDWLNTTDRTYTVTTSTTVDDYRNVVIGWVNLQWPFTLQADAGEATDMVYGRLWINGMTGPAGPARGIAAQVGYGDMAANPATWDWFPMTYNASCLGCGNNDEYMGVMTPTLGGVFSYTTRFDANWGTGNPNAAWKYAAETGVLTSTIYDLAVTKTALVDEVVVRNGEGALVTYTIQVDNLSTISPTNVITVADILPSGFVYVGDDSGVTPSGTGTALDPLTWVFNSPLAAGESISFTLVLSATDAIAQTGNYANTAAISADPPDLFANNNLDQAAVTVYRVISIAEARALPNGTLATIEGTVTAEPGVFVYISGSNRIPRYMYMQDETAGILIYLTGGLNPVDRYNRVRVTGALAEYRAERELIPTTAAAVVDLGPDTPVTPQDVNTGEVGEDVEGELIHVEGYIIAKPNAYTLRIDDGSGEVDVYRFYNLGQTSDPNYIDFTPFVVGDYISATGVSRGYDYSGVIRREVLPRGPADITELYPTTFVYHDLEGVMPDDVTLHVAGNFNGWSTTALPMSGNGGVYTASVILDVTAPYPLEFKIVAGDNWNNGRGDILNTNNRQAVITAPTTLHLYRNIRAGYAKLNAPAAIEVNLGETTPAINGEAWFSDLPFGTNQVLRAQIGYGTDANPTNWTWVEAAFSGRNGNNDIFAATLTPAAPGVYSYTIRFNGNWATTNPHSTWYLGDLDGVYPGNGFDIGNVGVLTVTAPDLSIAKTVEPTADVDLGDVVTYTITLSNNGDGAATNVVLTDTLPGGVTFGGWVQQSGATYSAGTISWSGNLPAGTDLTIAFTAIVDVDYGLYGDTIVNTVEFDSDNGGSGSDEASFTVIGAPVLVIDKAVAPTADLDLGDAVVYTITLTHDGGGAAYGVVITDALPAGVTFGGFVAANGATEEDGVISWNGDLPIGEELTIVFAATVDMDYDLYGETIDNTVEFASDNAGSGSASASFTVIAAPVLVIDKAVTPDTNVETGSAVTYTITLTHDGGGAAYGVVITDALPAGVTFGGFVAANGATEEDGVISWNGDLPIGGEVTIVFTANVGTAWNLHGQTITNQVTFTSDNGGDGSAEAAFTVKPLNYAYLPLVVRRAP